MGDLKRESSSIIAAKTWTMIECLAARGDTELESGIGSPNNCVLRVSFVPTLKAEVEIGKTR